MIDSIVRSNLIYFMLLCLLILVELPLFAGELPHGLAFLGWVEIVGFIYIVKKAASIETNKDYC